MQDIEIAPRNSRGFFLLVHIVGYAFGSCAVAVVGYVVANQSDLGWRLLFAMGTLPALTVLLVTPWLYETPHRWDVTQVCGV
jgi:MFS family permease